MSSSSLPTSEPLLAIRGLNTRFKSPRGYEHAEFQVLDDGSPADLKESFSLAADGTAGEPQR